MLLSTALCADEVEYVVSGVSEPILTNVINHVSAFRVGSSARLNNRLRRKLLEDAKSGATDALRPFGYFNPVIKVSISSKETRKWVLSVEVQVGPPVIVENVNLGLTGSGSDLEFLKAWCEAFPLAAGMTLDQLAWESAKQEVVERLEEVGYLQAEFSRQQILVDPVSNTAQLDLVVNTGPQALMGQVTFNQDILNEGILDSLQRFQQGDPYNAWLLERFRLDLWRSGYFEDIEVVEQRELTARPPRVDFVVNITPRNKNTYQGTIGYGTDTLARLQFRRGRHLLSPRGDNFDVGFGWQQRYNEFTLQANYRLPRKTNTRQFWLASFGWRSEKQTLEVSESGDLENRFSIARGTIDDVSLRLGKTRVRNMRGGFEQLFETMFVEYLNENRDFEPTGNAEADPLALPGNKFYDSLLKVTSNSLAIGMDWDWPEIRGSGFQTMGHRERAWVFTSNEAWGSDIDFTQLYLSSRWNFLVGDRWKFLLRGEIGYSDARTQEFDILVDENELGVYVSELPHLYRFKAGGSRSVRGYAYESLDENGLGSNNVLTASAEVEYLFHEDWSAAAFIDSGNAFNDWSKPDLKLGVGFGVRWYSLIGAWRLDVAQGRDLQGDPWRIHLTIGTPLL